MTLPNFLIIGAAKSGTTALYHYLNQHPDIYMSPLKETNFFALEGTKLQYTGPGDREAIVQISITNRHDFEALFSQVADEHAIGEASPLYLYSERAPVLIKQYVPQVKLIAVLRDPAERAFSSFCHLRRDSREPEKIFSRSLQKERERIDLGWEHIWHYANMGFYARQLRRYFALFKHEQIRVYLYEDFVSGQLDVLNDIFSFLGVDPCFIPNTETRHNESLIMRSESLGMFLDRPSIASRMLKPVLPKIVRRRLVNFGKKMNVLRPKLDPNVRAELVSIYREDILELQDLIGRDLSAWLV